MTHMTHAKTKNSTLVFTLISLFVLLGLTVAANKMEHGALATVIALLIASAKAVIVGLFFMDLRKSTSLTRLFATAGLLWIFIMLVLTMCDYVSRGM